LVRQGEEKEDKEASMSLGLSVVGPFDVLSESANVGVRWEKWINSFNFYLSRIRNKRSIAEKGFTA
jgi:hypothetical protein